MVRLNSVSLPPACTVICNRDGPSRCFDVGARKGQPVGTRMRAEELDSSPQPLAVNAGGIRGVDRDQLRRAGQDI